MVGTVAASLGATILVVTVGGTALSYRSSEMHVAIETAATVIGGLACLLMIGRFWQRGELADVVLAGALATHALASGFLAAATIAGGADGHSRTVIWTAAFLGLLGTLGYLFSALIGRTVVPRATALPSAGGAVAVAAAAAGAFGALAGRHLATVSAGTAAAPSESVQLLAVQVVAAAMFFAAAAAFAVKASRSDDRFVGLFAVACVLGGFARVNYALVPSLYTNQVFSGDAFRLVSCGVLMSAAFIEIVAYWRIRAIAAALEERRRLAYDLHDGLAQELAFIVSEASRPDAEPGSLAAAAERALFEARQAIAALTISEDEPFAAALERVVREVPRRDRVAMSVGRISVEPPRAVRDDLLRIAREAILNAVKHAHADEIWVELTDVPLTLRVVDDGVGFDPGAPLDGDHFGIASMRTRSARIGATLSFLHGTAGGTTVEVALP